VSGARLFVSGLGLCIHHDSGIWSRFSIRPFATRLLLFSSGLEFQM